MCQSWRSLFGVAVLLAAVAHGADAAAQDADAEALRQGRDAYARKDYEAARLAFGQAFSLQPKASTLLKLGLAELESNHVVEATKHLRAYLAHTEEPADERDAVRTRWLPRAESQTAELEVTAPAGAEVLVDDLLQGKAPLGMPIVVAVGSHEVTTRQGTVLEKQAVSVSAGGQVVELHFQRVADAPPASAATVVVVPLAGMREGAPSSSTTAKTVTVIGLGAGALAALGIGVGFGIASNNSASQFRSLRSQLTSDSACTPMPAPAVCGQIQQAIHSTNNDHALSMGFEIGSGVLAAAAAGTWLLWRPRTGQVGEVKVTPELTAHGGGLTFESDW